MILVWDPGAVPVILLIPLNRNTRIRTRTLADYRSGTKNIISKKAEKFRLAQYS
jgi:hypothetical protein